MGWRNPPVPWSEMEGLLSDRRRPGNRPAGADGGDSPAWSTKRAPYVPPVIERPAGAVPYAELHAHSSFSFLDGASSPEELAEEAERQGLHALAITDHDGFYGIVRFAEAAEGLRLKTVFGAELSLELPAPQNGEPDPVGAHLLVLARGEEGYHRLAGALTHSDAEYCLRDGAQDATDGHQLVSQREHHVVQEVSHQITKVLYRWQRVVVEERERGRRRLARAGARARGGAAARGGAGGGASDQFVENQIVSVEFGLDRFVITFLSDVDGADQAHYLARSGVSVARHGSLHHRAGGACLVKRDEIGSSRLIGGVDRVREQRKPGGRQQHQSTKKCRDPNRSQTFFTPKSDHLILTP